DYGGRRLTVFLSLAIATVFLGTVLLTPSFFISQVKYGSLKAQLALMKEKGDAGEAAMRASVEAVKKKLSLLRMGSVPAPVAPLIASVVERRGSRVTLRSFDYERRTGGAKLDIRGVAETRESLTSFVDRLKLEPRFAEVYSPVSNLVKDKNIEFTIQIAVAPAK
ncbi:hypothetical protein KW797_02025, partial [Candidatus Parcubacteria bacterium]|nr:hypothetical protein [Candidatus Parcubacteria bacterium]